MIEQTHSRPGPVKSTAGRVFYEETVNIHPRLMIAQVLAWPIPLFAGNRLRATILRLAGFNLGPGTVVWGMPTFIGGPGLQRRLVTGERAKIGVRVLFDLSAEVYIGPDSAIGPETMFLTSSHQVGPANNRTGELDPKPIWMGSGCWIGARVTILPGVKIGSGCVIAAGAVVTKDIPDNALVAGIPAKVIRTLDE